MDEMKPESSGPYVLIDGVKTDREIHAAEMDGIEPKFDKYHKIKLIVAAADAEIARREGQAAFESLMEAFKNY